MANSYLTRHIRIRTPIESKQGKNDMLLATIGFYYDFTRFFAALHGQTTPTGKAVKVCNYATHPSGYLFENARDMRHVFLPFSVRVRKADVLITEDALDAIGQYLLISGVSQNRARDISRRYVAFFVKEFQKNRPDVVIISGDTRMQSRSVVYACRKLGIRYLFFEQGPFGTTILDPKGVNCTASFAKTFPTARRSRQVGDELGACYQPPRVKAGQRKAVRALDYLMQPLFQALRFQEIREEKQFLRQLYNQILKLRRENIAASGPKSAPNNPFVLVIGQVPTDANFSLNSPYTTSLQLIREVEEMFPNMDIIFREHPLFIGSYGRRFYAHFATNPRLDCSRGQSLDSEIESADHIVVVNSTAGMEVVLKHRKPLLCLGDASYAHLNGVFSRNELEDFRAADAIDDPDHLANCLWFQESFLPGHFRDQNLKPLVLEVLRRINED